jgi:hypothetical protein
VLEAARGIRAQLETRDDVVSEILLAVADKAVNVTLVDSHLLHQTVLSRSRVAFVVEESVPHA